MHTNVNREPINSFRAVWRDHGGPFPQADDSTSNRRAWRKISKRNGGRKLKTLRSHRTGAKG